mmetsp:Transcript_75917/g.138880  ORF Transcript_75917/g.138880 Transcript_75917/m.138880 type:complete len:197 (+) Transcript_75917:78-668(+)
MVEQARYNGMLDSLKQKDAQIDHIVVFSKFVVAYVLQQDGPKPGWQKANIEGSVYLVRRKSGPRYQLLVKNQASNNDLIDNLHADWELDCQKNYVFYKVEDPTKRIRGLWFHDDAERQKLEAALEKTLGEIRTAPAEPQGEPQAAESEPVAESQEKPADSQPGEVILVSKDALRATFHALADDDAFIEAFMSKLKA